MVGGEGVLPQVQVNGLDKLNRRLFSEELESLREWTSQEKKQPSQAQRDFSDKNVRVIGEIGQFWRESPGWAFEASPGSGSNDLLFEFCRVGADMEGLFYQKLLNIEP